jgi:hypothetical protein
MKPIDSVTTAEYWEFILEKVLPAIEEKWPEDQEGTIKIQHDNAMPLHINNSDPAFQEAVCHSKFDIELTYQPPNSPDLNVLDLGFFNAIQSLQHQSGAQTIEELVAAMEDAFQ